VSEWVYTVIGTNVVIDCGTVEEAIAYERELWANHPYAPPAPLDVERLARAIERVLQDSDTRIGGPYAPLDSPMISVRFDRPAYAEAIAAAYTEETT